MLSGDCRSRVCVNVFFSAPLFRSPFGAAGVPLVHSPLCLVSGAFYRVVKSCALIVSPRLPNGLRFNICGCVADTIFFVASEGTVVTVQSFVQQF